MHYITQPSDIVQKYSHIHHCADTHSKALFGSTLEKAQYMANRTSKATEQGASHPNGLRQNELKQTIRSTDHLYTVRQISKATWGQININL